MRKHILFISSVLLLCSAFFISTANAAPPEVNILTGQKTGTYFTFGQNILTLTDPKKLTLTVKESDGSVANIKELSRNGKNTVGIVQSDVLGFLSRSQNKELINIASNMRMVFPFYQEEVHVLARKPIGAFKELQGKQVAIGEDGSGHMLTAVNLFAIEQIVPASIQKIAPEEALVKLLKGELDAVVFVGGKPVKLFKNLEDLTKPENQKFASLLQDLHFLPLNNPKFYEEYEPSEIIPGDYSFVKKTVPTIAVQAILISYQGNNGNEKKRCIMIKQLASTINNILPKLVESGHPKWNEVNLSEKVAGWKRDSCLE